MIWEGRRGGHNVVTISKVDSVAIHRCKECTGIPRSCKSWSPSDATTREGVETSMTRESRWYRGIEVQRYTDTVVQS